MTKHVQTITKHEQTMIKHEHLDLIYSAMVNVCERYRRSTDNTWEEKGDFFYVYLAEKFPLLSVSDAVDLIQKLRDDGFIK